MSVVAAETFKSKQTQVFEHLLHELRGGKLKPGARFDSENELVASLDVSRNTVREALTSLTRAGYLKRIQGKGTFVTGKLLRERRKPLKERTLALIAGNPHGKGQEDPFIGAILNGVHGALEGRRWNAKLFFTDGSAADSGALCERIASEGVADAAVCAGFNVTAANAGALSRGGVRCVSIGQPELEGVPFVDSDNEQGMREATSQLIAMGHRRIALLERSVSHRKSYESRKAGYEKALREAGLELDSALAVDFSGFDVKAGEAAAEALLAAGRPFSAAIIYGDWPTLGFMRELQKRGLKIPSDVSLVSFSSFDWLSQACGMEMARIANPLGELGRIAALKACEAAGEGQEPQRLRMAFVPGASACAFKTRNGGTSA